MGTNPPQRKIPDSKITVFFASLSKFIGFREALSVLSSLFEETQEHRVYLLFFHVFFFSSFDSFLLSDDLFDQGWADCYGGMTHREEMHLPEGAAWKNNI